MKKTFYRIPFSRNSKVPYEILNFFVASYAKNSFRFTLSLHWRYSIRCLVRFWQLLDPMTKNFFWNSQEIAIREIRKIPYENPIFFRGKLYQKLFSLYTLSTLVILHTEFGSILTTPWPDDKELFLKFARIRNSRNSQNSVWNPIFFLNKLYQKFFLLYTFFTLVILLADFGLIWTTPWPDEKELFLKFAKFAFREIRKIPYEKPTFF